MLGAGKVKTTRDLTFNKGAKYFENEALLNKEVRINPFVLNAPFLYPLKIFS